MAKLPQIYNRSIFVVNFSVDLFWKGARGKEYTNYNLCMNLSDHLFFFPNGGNQKVINQLINVPCAKAHAFGRSGKVIDHL